MRTFVSLSTGMRIEYVEQGQAAADGVPAIFLHGVTDSWRSFEVVLPLLPPSLHALVLSQRGHGDSSRPTSGYRLVDMSVHGRRVFDARPWASELSGTSPRSPYLSRAPSYDAIATTALRIPA